MKTLFVGKVDSAAYGVATIERYVRTGRALGHEVAVFGEQRTDLPGIPFSVDVKKFDFAVFLIYQTDDFPDLPYLALLLDGIPKDRRLVLDPIGRYNETIRVEHDFNHLERLDGHQGWEWLDAMRAVAGRVAQPTLRPKRDDVASFLFYGFDADAVVAPGTIQKRFGLGYVGNNWQRWSQIQSLILAIEPLSAELGKGRIVGWDWKARPEWAIDKSIAGVDVDTALLERAGFETRDAIEYDKVIASESEHAITPIINRPLFNELGLVTNRMFQTFAADTIPLLMLPDEMVSAVYGDAARPLVSGANVRERVAEALAHPDRFTGPIAAVRAHLAAEHSIRRRFEQLVTLLEHDRAVQSLEG